MRVSILSEHVGVALTCEDGVEDGESRDPGNVADDVMEMEIHLVEGFLHALDVGRGHLNQAVAMPKKGTQDAGLIGGTESVRFLVGN